MARPDAQPPRLQYRLSPLAAVLDSSVQKGGMIWLRTNTFRVFLVFLALLWISLLFLSPAKKPEEGRPADTMWLSKAEIQTLKNAIAAGQTPNAQQVLTWQINNLVRHSDSQVSQPSSGRRIWLILLPVGIAFILFIYLVATCYPPTIFAWGDEETSYREMLGRRKTLWSLLIGSLLFGVVANLFVLGVSSSLTN